MRWLLPLLLVCCGAPAFSWDAPCEGTFLPPRLEGHPCLGAATPEDEARLRLEARQMTSREAGQLLLQGGVCMAWEEQRLAAPRLLLEREDGSAILEEGLLWSTPEGWVEARSGRLRFAAGSGQLKEVESALPSLGLRGRAHRLEKCETLLELWDAEYSTCPLGDNSWRLAASRMRLDTARGLGTARNLRLHIGRLPVLYLPYWSFPLGGQRRSGLLAPEYGRAGDGELVVGLPVYFNLAPNYDATVTPRHHEGRGALLETQLRHLGRAGRRTIGAIWLPEDRVQGEERWLLHWSEEQRWRRWGMRVDYGAASDGRYLLDLQSGGLESKRATHLRRFGELYHRGERLAARLQLREYQQLENASGEEEPYRLLPRLEWSWRPARRDSPWSGALLGQYSRFTHPDLPGGERLYLEPRLGGDWFARRLRLRLALRHANYRLEEAPQEDEEPSYTVPTLSLDWRYPLQRRVRWGGREYRQLLTPRAYYLWAREREQGQLPDFDTRLLVLRYGHLFQENRFAGYDRAGDADQLALGLEGELRDPEERTLGRLRVGGLFYFRDREVNLGGAARQRRLSSSPLAVELWLRPGKSWSFAVDALWEERRDKMLEGRARLQYLAARDQGLQLNYRYRRQEETQQPLEQLELGLVWRVAASWRWISRWQYDLEEGRSLEDTLGMEYNSCCWGWRLLYQRGRTAAGERSHEYMLEFSLRGLGSSARRIEGIIEDTVEGFFPQ